MDNAPEKGKQRKENGILTEEAQNWLVTFDKIANNFAEFHLVIFRN